MKSNRKWMEDLKLLAFISKKTRAKLISLFKQLITVKKKKNIKRKSWKSHMK